jgi:hypothetical protein
MRKHRTAKLPPPHLLLLEQGLLGAIAGLIFLGLLIGLDIRGLAGLIGNTDETLLPVFLLVAAFEGTFAAAAIAINAVWHRHN